MDLPSTGRTLQENFSGVIALDFSIDVVANTEQKNLAGPSFMFLWKYISNKNTFF